MLRRTQKPPSINGITIGYEGEPSAFAREIRMIFTQACSKAITDLRKRDFQPFGSDTPTPTPIGIWRQTEDKNELSSGKFLALFNTPHSFARRG